MPLINEATLVVGAGNFFTGPVGTAKPVDLTAPASPWANIGHTSLEDILGFESEGGEATILGTLQNASLRTSYSKRTDTLALNLQQFDEAALKLYFGSNATTVDGMVRVPANPTPTITAFLAVFIDQDNAFAIHIPKAEIFRGDNLEISDTESLASLPLRITPMQVEGNDWLYEITALTAA